VITPGRCAGAGAWPGFCLPWGFFDSARQLPCRTSQNGRPGSKLLAPFLPSRRRRQTWLRLLRQRLIWLWRQEGSHGQRARGLAAGVFTGCYPFFGLQIVLGIGLASLVRGNHLLAAAGTWISNPLTSLPLYWFNYQVGCWVLGPGPAFPSLGQLKDGDLFHLGASFTGRLMLGSSLVGLLSALLLGGIYWLFLQRSDKRARA
jgi:uncharacterized protein (DUF2062 family)